MNAISSVLLLLIFSCRVFLTGGAVWCFRCSWEWGDKIGNNVTTCSAKDENEIILSADKRNPQMNPRCQGPYQPGFYNKSTGYSVLEKGCYPNACPAPGNTARCAKWTYYLDGDVYNTTLFCAVSKEIGCFTQTLEGGYMLETCLCNDKSWCNSGQVFWLSKWIMFTVVFIMLIN